MITVSDTSAKFVNRIAIKLYKFQKSEIVNQTREKSACNIKFSLKNENFNKNITGDRCRLFKWIMNC